MILEIAEWMQCSLNQYQHGIREAFIFGSAMQGNAKPNDVDVLLVSKWNPDCDSWRLLQGHCRQMRVEFEQLFKLPLSLILLCNSEMNEEAWFVDALRPRYSIFTCLGCSN